MELPHLSVPRAVQRAAADALELHRSHALPAEQEVSGIAIAERLASGLVSAEDVAAMARFFQVNDRHYGTRLVTCKSAKTDGLCRSWALRGGEHGRVWAERQHAGLVREGLLPADPYEALLASQPDEVYARFAVGAFRWEYGLDTPDKAARFYEDYHRATGRVLDLNAAFGQSGPSVATAVRRRVYGVNPFDQARRALQFECAEYRLAATVDLQEMADSGCIEENIKPFLLSGGADPKVTAKVVWPVFVAHMILAAERPELLAELNASVKKPPTLSQDPTNLIQYADAVRIYIAFFHPKGTLFKDPIGTDFEDLPGQIEDLMLRAHLGRKILPLNAQKVLGAARRWTAENKLAGSLFHVYNADWKKGNWANILEALPLDADVRGPFQKFVEMAPVPADGVKLQQTLSDKKHLKAIAAYLGVPVEELSQRKIGDTAFGKQADALGTPAGIYSVLRVGMADRTLLGAFFDGSQYLFVLQASNGELSKVPTVMASDGIAKGTWAVLKAHKDMKLGYGAAHAAPKADVMATPKTPLANPAATPAMKKDASQSPDIDSEFAHTMKPGKPSPLVPGVEATPDETGLKVPHPAKPMPTQHALPVGEPFGFIPDEVVKTTSGLHYWIREVTPKAYRAIPLDLHQGTPGTAVLVPKSNLDSAQVIGKFPAAESLAPFITVYPSFVFGTTHAKLTPVLGASPASPVTVGAPTPEGVICALFEATALHGNEPLGLVAVLFTGQFDVKALPPVKPAPSYAPTEPKPESNVSEEPNELSGTQQAFDFLKAKGWKPMVASEGKGQFQLDLAGIYQYGKSKTRTILGYGQTESGGLVYVIRTETGKVNWKTTTAGNEDYQPQMGVSNVVQSELLPLPEVTGFPKLNYRLGKKAKAVAQASNLIYVPSPPTAAFHVGVKLQSPTGQSVRILGWIDPYKDGKSEAVVDWGGDDPTQYGVISQADVAKLSLHYEHGTSISPTGDVVFGKAAGAAPVTIVSAFDPKKPLTLPCAPPEGWANPTPIEEGPMPVPPKGKHVAAGILAVVPSGATLSSAGGVFVAESASIVLVYPSGAYGGYELAIPKGTVDKGESPLVAAVREFYEETGLTAKPVAVLGDFRASTSVVRLYVGYLTGGNPQAKPKKDEVDAVTTKPLVGITSKAFTSLDWWANLIPSGGSAWQQDAINKLVDWLVEHGVPQNYEPGQVPTNLSQVTHAHEVSTVAATGSKSVPDGGTLIPPDPDADIWKTLLFKAPFPVTSAMVAALQGKVKVGVASKPKEFNCAKVRTVGPSFGQVFETQQGTPYTAAGYVSWLGEDGSYYHYLLGLSGAGLIEALPAGPGGAEGYHVSTTDTESAASKDPWYSHPDPSVMARMKIIFQDGGSLAGAKVNMQTFKLNWLKEAGVPYYAVASLNILRELAGLFVPGALSEAQKDAVLACLKARMTATQSGKKTKGTVPVATNTLEAPAHPTPVAPPKPQVVLDKALVTASALATIAHPQNATFAKIGDKTLTASSKPTRVVQDQVGNKFFLKWRPGEPAQAETDKAAALLMAKVKGNVLPVNVFDYEGQRTSIQPFFDSAVPSPSNPNDLSDANKAELLSQHAFDMFVGDHDGHGGNWIQVGSKIIAVDRGQAFKFLFQHVRDSLDPSWHAPGNFGEGYAKRLLKDWSAGKAEIPTSAFAAMRATIESIQSQLTTDTVKALAQPMFDARGTTVIARAKLLALLDSRRASYLDDWTTVLKKLRKDFAWPGAVGGIVLDFVPLKSTPADLEFGKQEEQTIAEATKAGWQGKSLRIDGPFIENQEVMCKAVLWEETQGVKTPATLIHFRLTKNGGLRAAQALLQSGVVETSDGPGGPQRLAVDKANSLYEKLFAAIKTINYHLNGPKADGIPNAVTVAAAIALKPMLQEILEQTKNPKGTFGPTGEPNEAVNAMADQYLGYVSTVEYWNTNAPNLLGQHSPQFTEFVYEEPPQAAKPKPKKTFQAKLKNQGASYPNITTEHGQIVVRNLHKPVVNSSQVSQFVIEDPKSGARVFFNPTAQTGDIKAGVQGVKGLCWGIIPGAPSAPVVAHLMKLFGEATNLPMRRSTELDQRVLFVAKQAAALQGGGSFNPTSDGTALVEPPLVQAMSAYEMGNAQSAYEQLVATVAAKVGMTAAQVDAIAAKEAAGTHDARGAGFFRHNRIGWDVKRVKQVLGANTFVAHALLGHGTTLQFFKDVAVNGALIANEVKPFYGVVKDGASPSSDFQHGGSQGVFCCLRKGTSLYAKHLYFDLSLALRLDVYMVGKGDSFGNVNTERYTMPDKWSVGSGAIGASSSGQLLVRHDIDLQTYLVHAKCANETEAAQCIALVKQLGWQFKFGPPEKIFTA